MVQEVEKEVYKVLDELKIPYSRTEHEATITCEEADKCMGHLTGTPSKSLFLTNKKKTDFYLIIMNGNKPLKIKEFSPLIGEKHVSFASEEKMMDYLKLKPGMVSVFGLINNKEHDIKVVVDTEILEREKITFHPNINTATIEISVDDMFRFIEYMGNPLVKVEFP